MRIIDHVKEQNHIHDFSTEECELPWMDFREVPEPAKEFIYEDVPALESNL